MRRLWQLRRVDFWLAMIALVGVLVVPTLQALGVAVVASLGVLVWRASEGRLTFLGRASGGLEPVDLESVPDAAIPGLLIVRPDEMLFSPTSLGARWIISAANAAAPHGRPVDLSLTRRSTSSGRGRRTCMGGSPPTDRAVAVLPAAGRHGPVDRAGTLAKIEPRDHPE
jgi:hypothetical protein